MRADAQRNRKRLLDAAVEEILAAGGDPARDAIAERAGVGIGTLYRHFPDREALLGAVVRHVLERTITAGEGVLDDADDPADALRRYMHLALDLGLGVVGIVAPLLERPHWPDLRERAGRLLSALVGNAQRDGVVRDDVTVEDIAFAVIRVCRPLAAGLDPSTERAAAHRHIDVYVDGMSTVGAPLRSSRLGSPASR